MRRPAEPSLDRFDDFVDALRTEAGRLTVRRLRLQREIEHWRRAALGARELVRGLEPALLAEKPADARARLAELAWARHGEREATERAERAAAELARLEGE